PTAAPRVTRLAARPRLKFRPGAAKGQAVAPDRDALVVDPVVDLDRVAAMRVVHGVLDRVARKHVDRVRHSSGGKSQQHGSPDSETQEPKSHREPPPDACQVRASLSKTGRGP